MTFPWQVIYPLDLVSGWQASIQESALLAAEFTGTFYVVLTQATPSSFDRFLSRGTLLILSLAEVCTKMAKFRENDMGPQARQFEEATSLMRWSQGLWYSGGHHLHGLRAEPVVTAGLLSNHARFCMLRIEYECQRRCGMRSHGMRSHGILKPYPTS